MRQTIERPTGLRVKVRVYEAFGVSPRGEPVGGIFATKEARDAFLLMQRDACGTAGRPENTDMWDAFSEGEKAEWYEQQLCQGYVTRYYVADHALVYDLADVESAPWMLGE